MVSKANTASRNVTRRRKKNHRWKKTPLGQKPVAESDSDFYFCSLTFWWSTSEGISQPGDWHQQFLNFKPGTSAVILLDNGYHLPPSRGTHEEKDGSYAPTKGEKCEYTSKINS